MLALIELASWIALVIEAVAEGVAIYQRDFPTALLVAAVMAFTIISLGLVRSLR